MLKRLSRWIFFNSLQKYAAIACEKYFQNKPMIKKTLKRISIKIFLNPQFWKQKKNYQKKFFTLLSREAINEQKKLQIHSDKLRIKWKGDKNSIIW